MWISGDQCFGWFEGIVGRPLLCESGVLRCGGGTFLCKRGLRLRGRGRLLCAGDDQRPTLSPFDLLKALSLPNGLRATPLAEGISDGGSPTRQIGPAAGAKMAATGSRGLINRSWRLRLQSRHCCWLLPARCALLPTAAGPGFVHRPPPGRMSGPVARQIRCRRCYPRGCACCRSCDTRRRGRR